MTTSRREFLVLASLSGATLVLHSCGLGETSVEPTTFRPNLWLAIEPDGTVEFSVTRLEMGQGIRTGLTLLVADELALAPEKIRLRSPTTADLPASGEILQTGSSASLSDHWVPLRQAAAAAREMLVAAAAEDWQVEPAECELEDGVVLHPPSGRKRGIGELARAAARQPVPKTPRPRQVGEFRFIGRPTRRLEGGEIVTGAPRFAGDVRPAGLRFAVLARPPATGGRARAFDPAPATATPGVERVVPVDTAFAVVAEDTWSALRGREALALDWETGDETFSSAKFDDQLREALEVELSGRVYKKPHGGPRAIFVTSGPDEQPAEMPTTPPSVEAEYATGFQTHMAMETRNVTARFDGRRYEIWVGHQLPHLAVAAVADRLGVPSGDVVLHPLPMGGGFGGREHPSFVAEAALLARELGGTPVQIFWSREDDLQNGLFHPASRHRLQGWLDGSGRLAAWRHRVASPSIEARGGMPLRSIGRAETTGAWNLPYACERARVEYADLPLPMRLGFWRGIEFNFNTLAVECFIDELAAQARKDPAAFRLEHLAEAVRSLGSRRKYFDLDRLRGAITLAAERGDWGAPLAPGRGRGCSALVFDVRTAVATVAEVTVEERTLKVDRIVCAIDCGIVVNPLGLASNAEGAVAWGLSALFSEITFERGRAVESNHLDYPILRLPEMPAVEIHTVASELPPSGTGEIPVPGVAPAVLNAIFAATGKRLRRLPIRPGDLA